MKKTFLSPFLARDRRVSDAAAELGCSINRMLYQVRTLLAAGLLHIAHEEPRAGRTIKVYRSVHDAYFVPFGSTPYDTLEQRVTVQGDPIWAGLIAAYADALRRSDRHGHLIRRVDGAVTTTDQLPDTTPNGQALFWSDSTLMIRDADARQLGEEVRQWYERAQMMGASARHDSTARRYLCLAAFLPSQQIRS
ncbi:hypothetical protein ABIB25_005186 [Nakamurella sp. UYEF19]|uniref:hypothetical protein n=1 Tax=Nakamurella sp. UYEF19 TaxID=1756392 RepID=UPI003397793D